MFNNLIESKKKKTKTAGGTLFSFVVHATLIPLAVIATAQAAQQAQKPKQEKIDFVEVKKEEVKPKDVPPPVQQAAPPPPKGFQTLSAPIDIPDVLPDIDLSRKVTDEADFTGKGSQGGIAKGVEKKVEVRTDDQPYFEFQVEKPVVPAPGSSQPRYPDILRQAGVEGEVLAQFVVDTSGRAEAGSFKVLRSSHDLFAQAVKSALPGMRFIPAEVGGKHVKQLVQQPFTFAITK
ncbi:MAG: energy transducer TonB [Gemmatimonadaceae bacterium]